MNKVLTYMANHSFSLKIKGTNEPDRVEIEVTKTIWYYCIVLIVFFYKLYNKMKPKKPKPVKPKY